MSQTENVHFTIKPARPGAHIFEVTCTIAEPAADGQTVSMAAWIPGSYMIRDFARNVIRMDAECDGTAVVVEKQDKQTWRCAHCPGPLTLRYEVYAWDLSVRSAHLDDTHGYFNGTSVFLRVHEQERHPATVELLPPDDDRLGQWQVATTLPRVEGQDHGFGLFRAGDYEELVDHPVEMGAFTLEAFEACGVPHEVAITGRHNTDTGRLARDLKRLCEHHVRFFGEPPPFDRFLFQVMAVGDGYGGLEHRASTSLMCNRDDLPAPGSEKVDNGYRRFLGLCSHEYFHSWNVKRIMPAAFQPFDLEREVHTPLLWAFEGITSYYDDLGLVRSGLITAESYLELLSQTVTRVIRGPGRYKQSIAESSFDAWTKFYKQDENGPNAVVSYYAKGALAALALDLTIRKSTAGERALDDVMRTLWERHGRTGQGITPEDIEALCAEIAGTDLQPFFDTAVRGTDDLPLTELLADVGIDLALRPAENAQDFGGKAPGRPVEELQRLPALGVRTAEDQVGARIAVALEGGPAQLANLSAGDVIVAVGGLRATAANLGKLLERRGIDETIEVHAFRRDELMRFDVRLSPRPSDTCVLTRREGADETTVSRRAAWLGTDR